MKFRIEVICVSEDGAEQRSEVRAIERQVAIIGTGREGLAFVVLSLRSTRRRCPEWHEVKAHLGFIFRPVSVWCGMHFFARFGK